MGFSSSLTTLLYLTKNALSVTSLKFEDTVQLDFPEEVVANLEVINSSKFEALVTDFLSQVNLKKEKVLLILAEEVLFQKNFSQSSEETETQIREFIEKIPFDPEKIKKIELKTSEGVLVVAANKEIFQKISEVVGRLGGEVAAVVPATIFEGLPGQQSLSKEDIKVVSRDLKLVESANFYLLDGHSNISHSSPLKYILFILALMWLGLIFLLIFFP